MKTNLIYFIVLFCLFSCKGKNEGTPETDVSGIPVIDLKKALNNLTSKKMNFSEFADDITYIPLETRTNVLTGGKRVPPIHITDNYIFYGGMMFRRDGSFVRELGKQGRGPGEYILARSIGVDEKREEFYVYCNYINDIFVYDFSNNFKKQIKVGISGGGITILPTGKAILSRSIFDKRSDFFEYHVIDLESGSVLYTRMHDKTEGESNCTMNRGWTFDNKLFYYEGHTDTIFSLTDNGEVEKPRYIVKIDNQHCTNENYKRIGAIVESKSYLFFNITTNSGLYYAVYNKETGEIRANKFDEFFNNDIDGGFLWLFKNIGNEKEGYFYVLPHIAQERIETLSRQNKGYDKEKNKRLIQLLEETEPDANEIFYFLHFK